MIKKIVGIMAIVGIIVAFIPATGMASSVQVLDEDAVIYEEAGINKQYKDKYGPLNTADTELIGKERIKNRYVDINDETPTADMAPKKYVTLRGIWGHAGDNESDGYFAARISKKSRRGMFRGVYNTTDNETKGKIFGVMRNGYFHGKIITPEGNKYRITGLYNINRENKTFKMRWMTPGGSGWAVAKIAMSKQ